MTAQAKFFQNNNTQAIDLAENVVTLVANTEKSLTSLSHTARLLSKTLDQKADATEEYKNNYQQIAEKMQSACRLIQNLHQQLTGLSPHSSEEVSNIKG
jgi:hypothetical protein